MVLASVRVENNFGEVKKVLDYLPDVCIIDVWKDFRYFYHHCN